MTRWQGTSGANGLFPATRYIRDDDDDDDDDAYLSIYLGRRLIRQAPPTARGEDFSASERAL